MAPAPPDVLKYCAPFPGPPASVAVTMAPHAPTDESTMYGWFTASGVDVAPTAYNTAGGDEVGVLDAVVDELGVPDDVLEGDAPGGRDVVGVGAPVTDGHTMGSSDTSVTLPPGDEVPDALEEGPTRAPPDHVA